NISRPNLGCVLTVSRRERAQNGARVDHATSIAPWSFCAIWLATQTRSWTTREQPSGICQVESSKSAAKAVRLLGGTADIAIRTSGIVGRVAAATEFTSGAAVSHQRITATFL